MVRGLISFISVSKKKKYKMGKGRNMELRADLHGHIGGLWWDRGKAEKGKEGNVAFFHFPLKKKRHIEIGKSIDRYMNR